MTVADEKLRQIAQLLAWYREMGVTVATGSTPIDWLSRGDIPPGAGFAMPEISPPPVGRPPARAPLSGSTPANPPAARPAPRAANVIAPPASRPQQGNVRAFDGQTSSAVKPPQKVDAASLADLAAALTASGGAGLSATAKNLCFYAGAATAPLMLIGEAPGREDDLAGEPFSGSTGDFLRRMLASIFMTPTNVHLTNLVYWRPPGNRKPSPAEIAACAPYLARQIELVAPKVIVALGDTAARQILGTAEGIMKSRGKWRELPSDAHPVKAIATLDPAYVLKFPASKRQVWRDLLAISAVL